MPGHLATLRERDHDGASLIVIMEAAQDRTPHSLFVIDISAGCLRFEYDRERSDRRKRNSYQR